MEWRKNARMKRFSDIVSISCFIAVVYGVGGGQRIGITGLSAIIRDAKATKTLVKQKWWKM